jgi:hypothetical protein
LRLGWVLIACGCRLGFDAVPETPGQDAVVDTVLLAGHDEDGDTVDDAIDVCPHVADPQQPDGDQDGVGDACDPHPTQAIDRIVFFDPFVGPRPEWTWTGETPTYSGDRLVVDTRVGARQTVGGRTATPASADTHVFGGNIAALGAGMQFVGFGFVRGPMFPPAGTNTMTYYCEHCAGGLCGGAPFLSFTYSYDNSTFTKPDQKSLPAFAVGPITFQVDTTSTSIACSTTWPTSRAVGGAIPAGISPLSKGFALRNLLVQLDYYVEIHSD